jgi:type IV secretory pathway TrbL component
MGSRGPKAAPKVLAAANRILLAEQARGSLSAKAAMVATGLYTEEECTDNAQRAVRKQAQTLRNRTRHQQQQSSDGTGTDNDDYDPFAAGEAAFM